jgi:rubrerythrin
MTTGAASRRELLRRGAVGAGAIVAAGTLRPALAGAQAADDEDLRDFLVEAIGLEQVTVLAYAGAADAAENGGDREQLEEFRDQEQAHANALRSAIDELGFDPPEPADSPADTGVFDDVEGLSDDARTRLTDQLADIEAAKSARDFLRVLLALENAQLELYAGRGPELDSPDLATTAAEIAGCQGQHLVVLGVQEGSTPAEAATAAARTAADAVPSEPS